MTDEASGSVGQLRHAAARGVVSMVSRNAAVRVLGLAGNIALARLLTPSDFGTIALGLTLSMLGTAVAVGGIGASLARRPEEPESADLQAALAFQLVSTLAFVAVVAPIALSFGTPGAVAALMVCSLPIDAQRVATSSIALRRLDFGLLARSAVIETLVFNVGAIGLVAAGLGVWGVAIASIARALVGTAVLNFLGPVGWLLPRWDGERIRLHLRFGAANQATLLVTAGRDQGLNFVVAAVGGLAALGVWALAYRMLQMVLLVMQALWQVAFPAIARLLASGQSGADLMRRGVRLVAIVTGLAGALLGGTAPAAVPVLFGPGWGEVPELLALGAASLMISGPITTLGLSFLWAVDAASSALRCTIIHTITWLGVTAALLPVVGSAAAGIGMLVGAFVVRYALLRAIRRHIPLDEVRLTLVPTLLALLSGTAGWLVADHIDGDVLALLSATAVTVAIFGGGAAVAMRSDVRALARLLRGALRRAAPDDSSVAESSLL